jgi:membrane protein
MLSGVVAFESVVGRPSRYAPGGRALAEVVTAGIFVPFFWWTMHFLLGSRVPWRKPLPSAVATGIFFAGLGVFSSLYFSSTMISDSRTYGAIGAVLTITTWLIAVGAVIILGAVAGTVWQERSSAEEGPRPPSTADEPGRR